MRENKTIVIMAMTVLVFSTLLAAPSPLLLSANAEGASQIFGTVTDAKTGDPIEGAEVSIHNTETKEISNRTLTDERGSFGLGGDSGSYTIIVSMDGYTTYKEAVTLEGKVEHNVELTPGDGKDDTSKDDPDKDSDDGTGDGTPDGTTRIHGTVNDAETHNPVAGADVTVYSMVDRKVYYQTQTDRGGSYELDCNPGDYTLMITKDGYESLKEEVTLKGQVEHNGKLTPGNDGDGKTDDGGKDGYDRDSYDKEGDGKDDLSREDINGGVDEKGGSTDGGSKKESGMSNSTLLAIVGTIIAIVAVIAFVVLFRTKKKGTTQNDQIRDDEWTSCPKCGTDLLMKDLSSHLDKVHSKLLKSKK